MFHALRILCYGLILLFGVTVSFLFSGTKQNRRNILYAGCFFVFALFMQIFIKNMTDIQRTKELYPLIVHLPLILFLRICYKTPWEVSVSSVTAAYLCCQSPRWLASLYVLVFPSQLSYYLCYIPLLFLCCWLLYKYAAIPVSRMMLRSKKSCLLFGAVPIFYYIFDYATTIYSNLLYAAQTKTASLRRESIRRDSNLPRWNAADRTAESRLRHTKHCRHRRVARRSGALFRQCRNIFSESNDSVKIRILTHTKRTAAKYDLIPQVCFTEVLFL